MLTLHGFGHIVAQLNLGRFVPARLLSLLRGGKKSDESGASIGRRLAEVCTELGPTFIKLAQLISTRPDIVPPEVLSELQKLQDKVAPFDTSVAREIIAEELGADIEEHFIEFDESPLASASIGQVYRAVTRDGEEVVVKVRRPDIEHLIHLDMQLLRWLAESLESFMPELTVYRPMLLVDEFDQALTRELDYVNEASATTRFAEAFEKDEGLSIPKVYWELSGERVLTLQKLDGVNLDRILEQDSAEFQSVDKRLIARRLADCYLKQIFELGIFHADPHPGNILISKTGTVGLIDFGQIGTLGADLMGELVIITYAGVNREMNVVVETLADLGALGPKTDPVALGRAFQVLHNKYYGLPIKRLEVNTLFAELTDLIRNHDVVVPRDMSLLFKALSTVGVVTRRLDPDLNLLELLQPRIRKAMTQRFSPSQVSRSSMLLGWDMISLFRKAPGQLRTILRRVASRGLELHVKHSNLDKLINELDRSSNRLAFSIVIAAIIVGSSVVISTSSDVQLFGIEVRYVGIAGYLVAGILGLGLSWAIFRSGRLH